MLNPGCMNTKGKPELTMCLFTVDSTKDMAYLCGLVGERRPARKGIDICYWFESLAHEVEVKLLSPMDKKAWQGCLFQSPTARMRG